MNTLPTAEEKNEELWIANEDRDNIACDPMDAVPDTPWQDMTSLFRYWIISGVPHDTVKDWISGMVEELPKIRFRRLWKHYRDLEGGWAVFCKWPESSQENYLKRNHLVNFPESHKSARRFEFEVEEVSLEAIFGREVSECFREAAIRQNAERRYFSEACEEYINSREEPIP